MPSARDSFLLYLRSSGVFWPVFSLLPMSPVHGSFWKTLLRRSRSFCRNRCGSFHCLFELTVLRLHLIQIIPNLFERGAKFLYGMLEVLVGLGERWPNQVLTKEVDKHGPHGDKHRKPLPSFDWLLKQGSALALKLYKAYKFNAWPLPWCKFHPCASVFKSVLDSTLVINAGGAIRKPVN